MSLKKKVSHAYHRGDPRDARQQKHADFWGPLSHQKGTVPIWESGKPTLRINQSPRGAFRKTFTDIHRKSRR